jgi:hypothetical protein
MARRISVLVTAEIRLRFSSAGTGSATPWSSKKTQTTTRWPPDLGAAVRVLGRQLVHGLDDRAPTSISII